MNRRFFAPAFGLMIAASLPATESADRPVRRELLTAAFPAPLSISSAHLKEVTMPPRLAAGRHVHPVPVIGVVTAGTIRFQLAGESERLLHAGDGFLEPAGATVLHFDNSGDLPATFVACYLRSNPQQELIRMLPE